jgi:transcriptional regulator with AAA-type ATPase domain
VDFAGNIGELSKEVYATALLSNASSQERGLDAKLIGKVDNLLQKSIL